MSGPRFRRAAALFLFPAVLVCVGCSGENRISGKVTFKGKPIPSGRIMFAPKDGKGGQAGFANIVNGEYDTAAPGGKGVGKGAVVVSIEGGEVGTPAAKSGEAAGKPYFPRYETTMDVTGTMTKDFDVPADAAKLKKSAAFSGP
jgi:hypothetical protein